MAHHPHPEAQKPSWLVSFTPRQITFVGVLLAAGFFILAINMKDAGTTVNASRNEPKSDHEIVRYSSVQESEPCPTTPPTGPQQYQRKRQGNDQS